MNFINKYSWKCLLGKQSKNITNDNDLYLWQVGKDKLHFCLNRPIEMNEIPTLYGRSFHYLSIENFEFIKKNLPIEYKATKSKRYATVIDLEKLDFNGGKYKKVRQSINKAKKYGLIIKDNYNKIEDVEEMIEEWSNVLAQKYFRDLSGKNTFFLKNNWHQDCINVFLYDGDKLVAFGIASPSENGYSSYIIGKALCHKYAGLSELADYLLYVKCIANGVCKIDLGQTAGGLEHYKQKFPGAEMYIYYDGKIELK